MPIVSDAARAAGYTPLAKTFHWIVAALVMLMFITIWIREETGRDSPERAFWTGAHTSLGILVLVLTVARLAARTSTPPPFGLSELAHKSRRRCTGFSTW
jgi:superoxide oxidase